MADIIGAGGKLSGGKSVTMVMMLRDDYLKGKKIISNIPLFHFEDMSRITYMSSEDFIEFIMKYRNNQKVIENTFLNASILIDEARGLYSARRSMTNLAEMTTSFIMMLGKLDCNFYYTFQIFGSQIDIQLREITNYIFECKRINKDGTNYVGPRIPPIPIFINVDIYEPIEDGLRFTGSSFNYDPSPYYKYYNTREMVIVDRDKYLKK